MRRKLIENGCLKAHRESFIHSLLEMGYTELSVDNYRWTIKCLDQFMHEHNLSEYTNTIGRAYLDAIEEQKRHTPQIRKVMHCIIRRFDCFMENGNYSILQPTTTEECPIQFAKKLNEYLELMKMRMLHGSTINQRCVSIIKALIKFDSLGVKNFSEIKADVIYDAYKTTTNKQSFCDAVRCFLRYLFETNTIQYDYSACVPTFRRSRPVPSVYTRDETVMLIAGKEKNANSSARNDAIILLALRLGMRSGDIANLKIENIDFYNKLICFTQEKTEIPQRLELLPEVETAIASYLSEARPISSIPNVFLTLHSPIRAISSHSIWGCVNRRLMKAGVNPKERNRGGHALRMTLASELTAEKVPYEAIRKILGHEDPISIKHYVQFDIESLRSCSLEIPPLTGKLAQYMQARAGVAQ